MRIALATIIGFIIGNGVNMGIIQLFVPVEVAPGGDPNEAMLEVMKSFTTVDYLIPLAAHVFGVLAGLTVARLICKTSNIPIYIIGGLHLLGTILVHFMIPGPTWFTIVDFVLPILIILYFLRTKKKQ